MVYGYIRVSTDKQTVENQRFEIQRFCKKTDWRLGDGLKKQSAAQSRRKSGY
jgi:DNA invertase Pin-like site-specific DNA recombinase